MKKLLKKIGYELLADEELKIEVPNVTLELREGTASIYNCLFKDIYSFYPY